MLRTKTTLEAKKCVGEVLDYRNTIIIEKGTIIENYFIRNERNVMTEIDGVEYYLGHRCKFEEVN